ncbi:dephospho-CoA kinase [Oryzomonas japonica]|uniref:dephospho-CoA kinase n=1 Tax=Oryzomonas japonica TaxID=2603858 RepID=UPI00177BE1A0|nr:dephospho-CoA kinase [Oryzomonas japonica]
MRVIGLTGGVATGKSSVARFFEERGVPVVDADQLAREAVKPGSPCLARLAALLGAGVLRGDGTLDRKRVAGIVFADADKRRQLEAVLHPEIRRLAEERITRAAAAGQRIVIYMAPLLIEAGVTDRVDEIWVVTVRPEVQLERLMARDGIGREEAERIIGSQMPLAEKERHGRVVIDNSGTLEETRLLLAEIWEQEIAVHHE